MLNETRTIYQYYTNDIDIINKVKEESEYQYGYDIYGYEFMTESNVRDFGDYYGFEVIKENNNKRDEGIYWAVEDLIDGLDKLIKNKKVLIVGKYKHRI